MISSKSTQHYTYSTGPTHTLHFILMVSGCYQHLAALFEGLKTFS